MARGYDSKIKIDEDFRPGPQLKTAYYFYLLGSFVVGVLPWYLPLLLLLPFSGEFLILHITFLFIIIAIFLPLAIWIPLFYRTIVYRFTGDEILYRGGVWFKTQKIVPYNRITNIDIHQGPISRRLKIAKVSIQTAGYSAPTSSGMVSETKIVGMQNYEEIREIILNFVKKRKPVGVETYDEEDVNLKIYGELVNIRKLLQKQSK